MNNRWAASVHEAGHIVAAYALGAKLYCAEVRGGGGHASYDGLTPTDLAFSVAAGPVAEELLADSEPPAIGEVLANPPQERYADAAPFATQRIAASRGVDIPDGPTDDEWLAAWAIKGREPDPESWAPRIYFVRHEAAKIVTMHREQILRLARELYLQGSLFGDDITAILETEK